MVVFMSAKEYGKLVKSTTGFRGAYPLVVPVKVGDYFEMGEEGVMVHLGNAFNWPGWKEGVPVDSDVIGGSETYFGGCKREMAADAGAEVSSPIGLGAEATVSLSFESESGFVLAYEAATRQKVRDVPDVQREIVKLANGGWWQEKWVLVTEVIAAESATLVVSASKGSNLSLHANVQVPQALGAVEIANPELGWTASSWRGSGFSSLCKPGTPLYHCIKVKQDWLGGFKAETLGPEEIADGFVMDDPFGEE
jgi:hypothetical protein